MDNQKMLVFSTVKETRFRSTKKVLCPYCKHFATYADISFHLAKCRKKDPKNALNFDICTYDWSHHVAKGEMETHLKSCQARLNLLKRLGNRPDVEEQIKQLRLQINEDRVQKKSDKT